MSFFNQAIYFVRLPFVLFGCYRHAETFLEAQRIKRRIFQLRGEFRCHGAQFHISKHINRLLVYLCSPPFAKYEAPRVMP